MVFDPYHNWLGIPPREQPPNYYRLLGIDLFEPNNDVVSHAADRQMAHLRTFQTSKHAAESQRLLNEVAGARHCLLDPARRSVYDAELRVRLAERAAPTGTGGSPLPAPLVPPPSLPNPSSPYPSSPYPSSPYPSSPPAPAPYPAPYPASSPAPYQDVRPSAPAVASAPPAAAPSPPQMPVVRPVPLPVSPVPFAASPTLHTVRARSRKNPAHEFFKIALGGLVGCAAGLAILWYGFNVDPIGWRGLLGEDSTPAVAAGNAATGSNASEAVLKSEVGSSSSTRSGSSAVGSAPPTEKLIAKGRPGDSTDGQVSRGGERGADSKTGNADLAATPVLTGSQRPGTPKNVADPFEPPARNRPRVAVPPPDAQAATLAVLQDLYKLDAMRLRSDKQQLAQKLLEASDEGTASDVERFVLLKKAAESAADAGDAPLVKRALDRLGQSFEFDVANATEKLLLRTIEGVRDESAMDEFVPTSQKVVFEFVSQNRLEAALRLTEATYAACLKPAGKRHRKFVYDGQTAIRKLHQLWVQGEEAREAIDRGEGTPEQQRVLGRFLCLQRGEWDQGLPHLAQADDAAIRAAAERDLSRPSDASLRIQLADLWYEVAKDSAVNEGFAVRASHWYELVHNDVTGLNKAKVTMRLEEMRNMVRDVDQRELSAAGLARQAKP